VFGFLDLFKKKSTGKDKELSSSKALWNFNGFFKKINGENPC